MLDNGRFPRIFTWRQVLQAHIDHEKIVYRRGFEFDLNKIKNRIHIVDGLLICLASIEEVVQTIKASSSTTAASTALQLKFLLDSDQAKAVLDMKLSRLAHLEVKKLQDEKTKLEEEAKHIQTILSDEALFNEQLKSGWRAVANKFGDARRTKILNLESKDEEPIEIVQLQVSLTNKNNIFAIKTSSLYTQKRGGVGNKIKLAPGEYIIDSRTLDSTEELLFFTNNGNVYHYASGAIPLDELIPIISLFPIKDWENVCAITANSKKITQKYIMFVTRNGIIKKSEISEYNINRNIGLRAIALTEGDEIVDVIFGNDIKIGIVTEAGNFLMINTNDIRAIGRVAQGIKAIKLNDGDKVAAAHMIPEDTKCIASISGTGLFKQTAISEFSVQGKNTKGSKLQKLNDGDWLADFLPITTEADVLIVSTRSSIRLTLNDIPMLSKGTLGNKSIKLAAQDNITRILTY